MNPALRAVLDRIKSRRVGPKTKLVIAAEPRTAMRRACTRLGLPMLRNHDLRHYFASVCIASGVDIPTVSRWLGHADGGALAMKTYGHLQKDHSQAAAKKWISARPGQTRNPASHKQDSHPSGLSIEPTPMLDGSTGNEHTARAGEPFQAPHGQFRVKRGARDAS